MQEFRRWLAAIACVVVGAASFALSYVALRDVAVATGAVPEHLGWLVPIAIDGGVICGSAVLWSQSAAGRPRTWFPFAFVAVLVAMSVVVNASHAGTHPLAKVIAALPPLILLGTLELVASQGRDKRRASAGEAQPLSERLAALAAGSAPAAAFALADGPIPESTNPAVQPRRGRTTKPAKAVPEGKARPSTASRGGAARAGATSAAGPRGSGAARTGGSAASSARTRKPTRVQAEAAQA